MGMSNISLYESHLNPSVSRLINIEYGAGHRLEAGQPQNAMMFYYLGTICFFTQKRAVSCFKASAALTKRNPCEAVTEGYTLINLWVTVEQPCWTGCMSLGGG